MAHRQHPPVRRKADVSLRLASNRRLVGSLSLLMATPILAAPAQDPVQKPGPVTRTTDRLPMPQSVTVRQSRDAIILTWRAVPGAKSYVLGRAVGNEGFRRLLDASAGPDTMYVDRQVRLGVRHVYTVTPVSQSEVAGVRATSEEIVPSPASIPTPPANVQASLFDPTTISVTWRYVSDATSYEVTRWMDGKWAGTLGRQSSTSMTLHDLKPGAYHFEVRAILSDGYMTGAARSNVVQVGAATSVSESPTTAATPVATAANDATAAVLVSVAAPAIIRVGGTTSLPTAGQWTSLDPGVATVTPNGAVTGRAAGTAQMVALGSASDGAVRVTVVRVVVQP